MPESRTACQTVLLMPGNTALRKAVQSATCNKAVPCVTVQAMSPMQMLLVAMGFIKSTTRGTGKSKGGTIGCLGSLGWVRVSCGGCCCCSMPSRLRWSRKHSSLSVVGSLATLLLLTAAVHHPPCQHSVRHIRGRQDNTRQRNKLKTQHAPLGANRQCSLVWGKPGHHRHE